MSHKLVTSKSIVLPSPVAGRLLLCLTTLLATIAARAETPTAPLPDRRLPRAILIFADGLGWGHAEEGDLGRRFARAGSVYSPDVDSAGVASRVSTGCDRAVDGAVASLEKKTNGEATGAMPLLAEAFAHKGAAVGIVTTKCLDDGTTSPFLTRWGDRYDLKHVAARIDAAFNAKTIAYAAGGFSNELRRVRQTPDDNFVFTTRGESFFARRCEYAQEGTFYDEAVRAYERVSQKADFLLILVHTSVDRASHAQDRERLKEALRELDATVETLLRVTNGTVPMLMFGAHDTGGYDKTAGFRIVGRAPDRTPVPVFVEAPRGHYLLDPQLDLTTMGALGRAFSPGLNCPTATTQRHSESYYYRGHARADEDAILLVFVFLFIFLFSLLVCTWDQTWDRGSFNVAKREFQNRQKTFERKFFHGTTFSERQFS